MGEYIDKYAFVSEMNERICKAIEWGKTAETDDIKMRAEQAIATFCEASLTAKKMPPADVAKVVHGEWEYLEYIDDDNPYGIADVAKCSVCGFWGDESIATTYRYCPNCGARMDL